MTTNEDVERADREAQESQDNAKRVRQQAADEHYEAANEERRKAEDLE